MLFSNYIKKSCIEWRYRYKKTFFPVWETSPTLRSGTGTGTGTLRFPSSLSTSNLKLKKGSLRRFFFWLPILLAIRLDKEILFCFLKIFPTWTFGTLTKHSFLSCKKIVVSTAFIHAGRRYVRTWSYLLLPSPMIKILLLCLKILATMRTWTCTSYVDPASSVYFFVRGKETIINTRIPYKHHSFLRFSLYHFVHVVETHGH